MNPTTTLPPEEQEQIAQTIEMFEVIIQANPHDTQSLEILKDAYLKIGKKAEAIGIARRLAQTLTDLNQLSAATIEYEWILQHEPDNPEIIAALGEVEERMHRSSQAKAAAPAPINLDFRGAVADTGTLIKTDLTQRPAAGNEAGFDTDGLPSPEDDGNEALSRFLIQHRIASEDVIFTAMDKVRRHARSSGPTAVGLSLIDEVVRLGGTDIDAILCALIERAKFAYIPLEYYEIDRQIVRMLPDQITFGRLMVPFDIMSRTLMIAAANPFDSAGREAVQRMLDYNIQWHLASPGAIYKVLQENFRVGPASGAMPSGTPLPASPAAAPSSVVVPPANPSTVTAPASGEPGKSTPPQLPDTSAFRIIR